MPLYKQTLLLSCLSIAVFAQDFTVGGYMRAASTGEDNYTTPFNPVFNVNNDALRYFSLFRSDEQTVILPG